MSVTIQDREEGARAHLCARAMHVQYAKVYSRTSSFLGVLENAKVGYTLKDAPTSTAKIELPLDDSAHDLCRTFNRIEVFDGDQRVELFRFIGLPKCTIKAQGGSCTYKAEHVIATLMDKIMPGYHEIGGTGVTMADCINYILGFQNPILWQLGTCDFTTQFQYCFTNAYLQNALLTLPKQLSEAYQWTFDTTTTPWTINLVRPSANVECEILYKHNMAEITKTYDDTALCTRCYPFGYGEGMNQLTIRDVNGGQLYLDADTQDDWGVVEKPFTDTTMEQPDALKRRALQWLDACKNPRITYTAKAIDLSRMTGDPMDTFLPGKLCRVNDQEHNVLVAARVTQITKDDPAAKPQDVTVTLSNNTETIANTIADLAARASVNELTAQGATNIAPIYVWNNADKDHPVEIPYDIVAEYVRINKFSLIVHIGSFRSYSQGVAAGGGTVSTTSDGGGGSRTSSAGGSQQLTEQVSVYIDNATTGSPLASSSANAMSQTDLEAEEMRKTNGPSTTYTGACADITTESSGSMTTNSGGDVSTSSAGGGNTESSDDTSHSHSFSGSDSLANGHSHKVTCGGSGVTVTSQGVSTNGTHSVTISGTTGSKSCSHRHYVYPHTHTGGSHTHNINGHTHVVPAHYHTLNSHTHTIPLHRHGMNHFHSCNIIVRVPALSINVPAHTHTTDIPVHSHSLTLDDHTHDDVPGIYDNGTVDTVAITVDGNAVPASAIENGRANLIPYLSKDDAGKVVRGEHTITMTPVPTTGNPNGLCSIGALLSAVVFVRSQGGGDY